MLVFFDCILPSFIILQLFYLSRNLSCIFSLCEPQLQLWNMKAPTKGLWIFLQFCFQLNLQISFWHVLESMVFLELTVVPYWYHSFSALNILFSILLMIHCEWLWNFVGVDVNMVCFLCFLIDVLYALYTFITGCSAYFHRTMWKTDSRENFVLGSNLKTYILTVLP